MSMGFPVQGIDTVLLPTVESLRSYTTFLDALSIPFKIRRAGQQYSLEYTVTYLFDPTEAHPAS